MATDFSRMTVIELRQELKRRNLPQTGKKADLIDRLATFDSDQTTSEPRDDNPVDDDNHESHDLPTEQDAAEPQNEDDSSNLPQQEDAVEAAQSTTAEEAPQAPITTQDSNSTSEAVTEPPKSAEASASIGDSAPEEVAAKVAATEAIPATEIITDAVSRKRRSRSERVLATSSLAQTMFL
jgi:SAP domain-containing ribonucleoprotein